ncbi:NfeD family protein [Bacillus spizizenii ATCC 6633 = JCM 2499]|uniref:Putative membrane bound hydrolase n=1 Tax=Bacillus spizizenii (strain ATCC 23059 / NRRL B-14472 / W23) TaxID=655816 RepID=E0U4Q3_BACSH|nr:nodulation protein NfeD [Bacillus spizizenii]QCJ17693.1 nodulation protein NfeD [Bacillus subtilis]ADM38555.1 putative membrane bound hydrolase [Bacillus spizizenii str. W23]AJW84117.1 membrane protein [Bacillus spizizenii]EFG90397.1 putative membrane bound hydrolase [Bacillus spizizenii ATCC 6633 = JCM 2499]KFK77676.1 serine dehydrogenase ase family protein [Bacillus spizizenii]
MLQTKGFRAALLSIFLLSLLGVQLNAKAEKQTVYVIPVEKNVEQGLASFLSRSLQDAKEAHADHIILDINTPGGLVKSAIDIADSITESEIPVTAYVNKRALSAGAYIALQADNIYMAPGGKMGAAAIIDGKGNAADQKAESLWLAELEDAAVKNNRDPKYALAMADPDIDAKEAGAPKGDLLTLNADKAIDVGYSEGTADNLSVLIKKLGLEKAETIYAKESFAEKTARWLTNPVIVPILLTIAFLGLTVELFSPGVGIPGTVGFIALLLFFYGHLAAGFAGYETVLLFIAGAILILLEIFLPGGIIGLLGLGAIIASLFLAAGSFTVMAVSLLIASAVSITAFILLTRVLGKRMKFFKKFVLNDSTNTENGYVSNQTRMDLIGKVGVTFTPLRPAGTVIIDDERLDVVSEGSFTEKDKKVKVVKVEGSRIVVREI